MKTKALLLALLALALPAAGATYRAGLLQSKIDTANDWTTALPLAETERTPGAVMANVNADDNNYMTKGFSNPWTGNLICWNMQNTTFGYTGQMWMVGGATYTFGKYLDDAARIAVDGTKVLENTQWNGWGTASYTPAFTGWHDVDIRVADGTGGKGPAGGNWQSLYGLGWNTNGVTGCNLTDWTYFLEDGVTNRFRVVTDDVMATVDSVTATATGFDFAVTASSEAPVSVALYRTASSDYENAAAWTPATAPVTIAAGASVVVSLATEETSYAGYQVGVFNADDSVGWFYQFIPCGPLGSLAMAKLGGKTIECSATVTEFGDGASGASVRVEASLAPSFADIASASASAEATLGTPVSLTLYGLSYSSAYYLRLRIENSEGEVAYVPLDDPVTTSDPAFSKTKVYSAGLFQAQFGTGQEDRTSDIATAADRTIAAGTVMADTTGGAKDWAGKTWSWADKRNFGYLGEMFMEGGTTYTFGKSVDDWTYVVVNGDVLLDNSTHNAFLTCSYTPAASGWVPVLFRFGNGGGGAGVSQSAAQGFAYNTAGNTSWDDFKAGSAPWARVVDDGSMSLLRCVVSETPYMTVGAVTPSGSDMQVAVSFAGVPAEGGVLQVLWGAGDGEYAAGSWDHVDDVATLAAGDTAEAVYTAPGAGAAAYVAFRFVSASGVVPAWEQWSEIFNLSADSPAFGLTATEVSYTNVTYAASCSGMGAGASSVEANLEIASDAEFQNVLRTVPLSLAGIGGETLALNGFVTNTTYYARVAGENNLGETGNSSIVRVTTLTPGFAVCAGAFQSAGFTSLSYTAVVTDWGADSSSALTTLEVSESPDFPAGGTLSFPAAGALSGALPASRTLTATGLSGDTAYHARIRFVNTWGLETVVTLAAAQSTLPTPVEMSAPAATPSGSGAQTLSIAALSVEPGTTYSVALAVDGSTVRTWSGQTEPGGFSASWEGRFGTTHSAVFTVSSTVGGATFSVSYPFTFTVGGSIASLSDLSELSSMVLRVGDTLVLPALGTGESLVYDTNAVVSASGTTFSALEPGACRIRRYAADPVTGEATLAQDGVLIVAPRDEDLHGAGLFVSRTATLGTVSWCNAANWQKISGDHDWPNGPGDVALVYLPLTSYTVTFDLGGNAVTVGHLGLGSTHSGNQIYLSNGTLTFRTGDGSESRLRMAGRNEGAGNLTIGASIVLENDLVVDGMGAKDMGLVLNGVLDVGPHVFTTDRVPFRSSGARWPDGQIQFNGDVRGSGEFRLRADSTASLGGFPSRKSFTGIWNPAACNHNGDYGGSALFLGNAYLGAAAAELKVSGAWFADKDNHKGASVRTGWSNGYQFTAPTNFWRGGVMPPKVTLDGGELNLITQGPLDVKYQDDVRENWYEIGEFRLATGPMGKLLSGISTWHNGCYPNSHTVVTNLVAEPGATAALGLDTAQDKGYGIISNDFHVVNSPEAAWDSGAGYEILPFFYPNCENGSFRVAVRDTATGRVTLADSVHSEGATGTIRLFQFNNGSQDHTETMPSGADYQSVIVDSNRKTAFAEENGVVRISSGLLGLRGGAQFGRLATATTASSTLDFGSRPGYVYVGYQNETADIGCRVAGTAGFVKSAGGTLRLYRPMDALSGGVWVDAGRLSLLDDATLGTNDVFVAAGAKLRITRGDAFGTDARLDLEDRDWISTTSRLELENAEPALVRRLYVNGENLHRGYYGSSEAEAAMADLASVGFPAFVDDRLFSGPGVLKVKSDDLLQPTLMILR